MSYDIISFKSITKNINDRVFSDFFYRLMLISRSLFEWKNLPNGIDEKWIEKYLFTEGDCLFFKDFQKGFMVTKAEVTGPLNYYDEPTLLRPYATNFIYEGQSLKYNKDCVLICNNDIMIPTAPTIELYAAKLTNIDRTIDTNITAQKMPLIIRCSDKQRLSLRNFIKQRDENEPVIYGDKSLDTVKMEVLKTDTPIVFDKLQIQKNAIWNECMTFLGINNANMDKRERLVDDEVQANNEQVKASEDVMLKARERACELINQIWGLNVSVRRRSLKTPIIEDIDLSERVEGGEQE